MSQAPSSVTAPPRKRAWAWNVGVVVVSLGVAYAVFGNLLLSRRVARIPLAAIGTDARAPIGLRAGLRLTFAIVAESYRNHGGDGVHLDVRLLRGGAVVGTMSCQAMDFDGSGSAWGGVEQINSDCAVTVPPGGVDAVAIATRLDDPTGTVTFRDLGVEILAR